MKNQYRARLLIAPADEDLSLQLFTMTAYSFLHLRLTKTPVDTMAT